MLFKLAKATIGTGLVVAAVFSVSPSVAGPDQVGWAMSAARPACPTAGSISASATGANAHAPATMPRDVELTPKAMKEIERINRWVNKNVESVADMDHWGVVDQWDYPTDGKGDCEDYVLLKRKPARRAGLSDAGAAR